LFGSAYGFPQAGSAAHGGRYPRGCRGAARHRRVEGRPERADYSLTAQADRIATVLDTLRLHAAVVGCALVERSMAYRLAYPQAGPGARDVALDGGPARSGRDARVPPADFGRAVDQNCSAACG